jgi:mono/diheme cytochrome c family protein
MEMRRKNLSYLILARVFITASVVFFLFTSCAFGPAGSGFGVGSSSSDTKNGSSALINPFTDKAMSVISNECTTCHTSTSGPSNIYGLTDSAHLLNAGLIVPGAPDQSVLYNVIASGVMPPNGRLSGSDQAAIHDWILAAAPGATPTPAPSPAPPGPTPRPTATPKPGPSATPAPTPTPTPTPAPPSFTSLRNSIFNPKCVACHSASGASAGYAFDSYAAVKQTVNTTAPASSLVYTVTKSGSMPKNSSSLTSAQLSQLLQWIQAGAPNN